MDVVINGRGLSGPMNGIPRYLKEIIVNLDDLLESCQYAVYLIVPQSESINITLKNIHIISLPSKPLWDFTEAEKYARQKKALYVCFSSRPVLMKNSISTVHDVRMYRMPEWKSKAYRRIFIKALSSCLLQLHRSKHVVTVSEFSKKEIIELFRIKDSKISVIGNGWEHILNVVSNDEIFTKHQNINKGFYYLSISSIAPHKNFNWIVTNARRHPQYQYVIVGAVDRHLWDDTTNEFADNIIYLGYQDDETLSSLIKNSKALVFPSYYEGFGIPPLETLANNVPIVVSDIPVMREIFGNAAHYIDPNDADVDLDIICKQEVSNSSHVLKEYSWKNSAQKWKQLIEKEIE